MKDAHEIFRKYINKKGLKNTPQRQLIVDTFLTAIGHLTTEEIYNAVKVKDPHIGQATVYRTMKLLCDSGLAIEMHFNDGTARYEHNDKTKHHDHLVCESCKTNIEVVDEDIERLQEQLAQRHGFVLTSHHMFLYGICARCRNKANK